MAKFTVYWGNVIEAATAEEAARAAHAGMCDPAQRGKWFHVENEHGEVVGDYDLYTPPMPEAAPQKRYGECDHVWEKFVNAPGSKCIKCGAIG
jgi:hypothetical protein